MWTPLGYLQRRKLLERGLLQRLPARPQRRQRLRQRRQSGPLSLTTPGRLCPLCSAACPPRLSRRGRCRCGRQLGMAFRRCSRQRPPAWRPCMALQCTALLAAPPCSSSRRWQLRTSPAGWGSSPLDNRRWACFRRRWRLRRPRHWHRPAVATPEPGRICALVRRGSATAWWLTCSARGLACSAPFRRHGGALAAAAGRAVAAAPAVVVAPTVFDLTARRVVFLYVARIP